MKSDRHMDFFILFAVLTLPGTRASSWSTARASSWPASASETPIIFSRSRRLPRPSASPSCFLRRAWTTAAGRVLVIPLLILSAALLTVLILPGMRHEIGGSARWLKISFLSFQPAELAKLALVIYLSRSLTKKEGRMKEFCRWLSAPHGRAGGFVRPRA